MSNLKDLVPPLKLCRMILSERAFAHTALAWVCIGEIKKEEDWIVVENNCALIYALGGHHTTPAPTTDEILAELAKFPHYFNNAMLEIDKDAFIVGAFKPNRGNPGSHLTENRDARPVVAALRLYLGLSDPSDPSEASDKTPDTGHNSEEVKK